MVVYFFIFLAFLSLGDDAPHLLFGDYLRVGSEPCTVMKVKQYSKKVLNELYQIFWGFKVSNSQARSRKLSMESIGNYDIVLVCDKTQNIFATFV